MFESNLIKVNGEWTTGDIGPKNLAVLVALPLIVAVVAIVLWKNKKEDSSKEQKEEKQRESENSFIDWLGCVIPACTIILLLQADQGFVDPFFAKIFLTIFAGAVTALFYFCLRNVKKAYPLLSSLLFRINIYSLLLLACWGFIAWVDFTPTVISEYQVDRRWQDNDNLRNFVGRPGSGSGGLPDYKLDLKSDTDKITLSVSSEFYWQVRPGESKIQVAFSGGPAFLRTYKILKILN